MCAQEHEGHRNRMRERFLAGGLEGFAPHEALELLLYYALPRRNVNPLAHRLIRTFGTLDAVLSAAPERLAQVEGVGMHTAVLLSLVAPLVRKANHTRQNERPVVTNYREAREFCLGLFDANADEVFFVVCLDAQGRVLRAVRAFTGTIDETPVYPRTVVRIALENNAHSVVLAHNHPSGVAEPSDGDVATTNVLREALSTVDIQILDHVIVADGEAVSLFQWERTRRMALPVAAQRRAADTQRPRSRSSGTVGKGEHEQNPTRRI